MELTLNNGMVSSDYIAHKTGKRKPDVHQDIKRMLSKIDGGNIHHSEYQAVKDNRGYIKEYLLNERLSLLLASGYNVNLRLAIIDDWLRLKNDELKRLKSLPDRMQKGIDELIEERDRGKWWMH